MNKLLLALSVVLLSGCASTPRAPQKDFTVVWHRTSSTTVADAFCQPSKRSGRPSFKPLLGCQYWTVGNVCHVVSYELDMETLGHELRHCFDGQFHNQNGELLAKEPD